MILSGMIATGIGFTKFAAAWVKANPVLGGLLGASGIGTVWYTLRSIPNRIYSNFMKYFVVRLEVNQYDEAYYWIEMWMASLPQIKNKRNFKLIVPRQSGRRNRRDEPALIEDEEEEERRRLDEDYAWKLVPGAGNHVIWYKGNPMMIHKELSGSNNNANATPKNPSMNMTFKPDTINISMVGRSSKKLEALIEDVVAYMKSLEVKKTIKTVKVFTLDQSYWSPASVINSRSKDSIISKNDIVGDIVNDMKKFIANKEWYMRRGLPFRRGYLFYGPPGTGKTSVVSAIAPLVDRPIYNLNLNTIYSDRQLIEAIGNVPMKAILLIEDIDAASVAIDRERKSDDEGTGSPFKVHLNTLLNSIDGIDAAEGRILILTTNHPEKLDAALKRPGRVDVEVLFDFFEPETALKMFNHFYDDITEEQTKGFLDSCPAKISPAKLQGIFMQNPTSPDEAIKALNNEKR